MPKVNALSVFLIINGSYKDLKDIVVAGCKSLIIDDGTLYYKIQDDNVYPTWVESFFGTGKLDSIKNNLKTRTVAAVYITSIDYSDGAKTFAIAFGYGRYLLNSNCIQKEFGVDTAKHAIDINRVKSIDTLSYDASIKAKTITSISEIQQNEFFLNADIDVLSSVKGKTRNSATSVISERMIGGKDAVSISAAVDLTNLKTFLKELYDHYVYKGLEGIHYTSNITEIKDDISILAAEKKLYDTILSSDCCNKIQMELPIEELKYSDDINEYDIGGKTYTELTASLMKGFSSMDDIKNSIVVAKKTDGNALFRHRLFDFLYAEIETTNDYLLLVSGKLYKVNKSYKNQVDTYYSHAKAETIPNLKDWKKGDSEGAYNQSNVSDGFLVMDEQFVYPEGSAKFEFCDLLSNDKRLIHAKIFNGTSQPLGHLFNQGLVSAKCFIDKDIRKKIIQKVSEVQNKAIKDGKISSGVAFQIPNPFKTSDYTISFLIMCKNKSHFDKTSGHPKIPFFAKTVFKEVATEIKSMGFGVSISGILAK